jgi:hypothetical protein
MGRKVLSGAKEGLRGDMLRDRMVVEGLHGKGAFAAGCDNT